MDAKYSNLQPGQQALSTTAFLTNRCNSTQVNQCRLGQVGSAKANYLSSQYVSLNDHMLLNKK